LALRADGSDDSDHTPIPPLQATFEGAKRFGLTEDEAWRAVDESLDEAGRDATMSEYLDDLTGALASRRANSDGSGIALSALSQVGVAR
jgi:hypothetical protein